MSIRSLINFISSLKWLISSLQANSVSECRFVLVELPLVVPTWYWRFGGPPDLKRRAGGSKERDRAAVDQRDLSADTNRQYPGY